MNFPWLISLLIILIYVASCQSSPPTPIESPVPIKPKSEEKIKQKGQKITVLIGGKGTGSGIIVARNGETYYVLTSQHVVGIEPSESVPVYDSQPGENIQPGSPEDPYEVRTYDGERYIIDYGKVRKDKILDLAIIEFTSKKIYPVANLATNVSPNQTVYVYGFKDCTWTGRDKKEEFNSGKVLSKIDPKGSDQGYSVQYTNPTITGMSGSPVFNQAGGVVAIHGKPGRPGKENEYRFDKCSSLPSDFGNNWGISMESFSKSRLAGDISVKFAEDTDEVKQPPNQNKENNPPNNPSEPKPSFKKSKS